MLGAPTLPMVSDTSSTPPSPNTKSELLIHVGWTSISDNMIGGSNNAGEFKRSCRCCVECQLLTNLLQCRFNRIFLPR